VEVDMNRDDAERVVREALATIDPYVAKAMRNVLNEAGYVVVAALVAAGWGDLAAERERLAGAVENRCRHDMGMTAGWFPGTPPCAACSDAARLIRETPEAPAQMTDTEWHAKRARALGHKTPGETP
jgi:hypothetical protein